MWWAGTAKSSPSRCYRRRACASAFPWPPSRSWCRLGGSQGETSSCSVARTVACGCMPPRMSSTEPPGGSPPWQGKTRTMWRGAFFAKKYRTLRQKKKIPHTIKGYALYCTFTWPAPSIWPSPPAPIDGSCSWHVLSTCLIVKTPIRRHVAALVSISRRKGGRRTSLRRTFGLVTCPLLFFTLPSSFHSSLWFFWRLWMWKG